MLLSASANLFPLNAFATQVKGEPSPPPVVAPEKTGYTAPVVKEAKIPKPAYIDFFIVSGGKNQPVMKQGPIPAPQEPAGNYYDTGRGS